MSSIPGVSRRRAGTSSRGTTDNISVSVRIRPLSDTEERSSQTAAASRSWSNTERSIQSIKPGADAVFTFDHVFGENTCTKDVYEVIGRDLVTSAMEGINGTLFAYGQTSSGKTHTMKGSDDEPGVIPRAIQQVFDTVSASDDREHLLRVSYMEIYNEEIRDLLNPSKKKLHVHEHRISGVFVDGLTEEIVVSAEQVMSLIEDGDRHRSIGSTDMNEHSSRSHSIFRMVIESRAIGTGTGSGAAAAAAAEIQQQRGRVRRNRRTTDSGAVKVSLLTLVDLAGSERLSKTNASGVRRLEGCHINKSLLTLGTVIYKLSEGDRGHIPFRESKLTRILQPALSGNTQTAIICTVTPATMHYDETLSSLKFGQRAKTIKTKFEVNEIVDDRALLQVYKTQIQQLQKDLETASSRRQSSGGRTQEIELLHTEREKLQQDWNEMQEKLQEEERLLQASREKINQLTHLILSSSGASIAPMFAAKDANPSVKKKTKKSSRRQTVCLSMLDGVPTFQETPSSPEPDMGDIQDFSMFASGALSPVRSRQIAVEPLSLTNSPQGNSCDDSEKEKTIISLTERVQTLEMLLQNSEDRVFELQMELSRDPSDNKLETITTALELDQDSSAVLELREEKSFLENELDRIVSDAEATQQKLEEANKCIVTMSEERTKLEAQLQTAEAIKKELSLQNVELLGKFSKMELQYSQRTSNEETEKRCVLLEQSLSEAQELAKTLKSDLALKEDLNESMTADLAIAEERIHELGLKVKHLEKSANVNTNNEAAEEKIEFLLTQLQQKEVELSILRADLETARKRNEEVVLDAEILCSKLAVERKRAKELEQKAEQCDELELELQKLQWDRELAEKSTATGNAEQQNLMTTLKCQLTEITEENAELKRQLIDGTVALASLDQQVSKASAHIEEVLTCNQSSAALKEDDGVLERVEVLTSFLAEALTLSQQEMEKAKCLEAELAEYQQRIAALEDENRVIQELSDNVCDLREESANLQADLESEKKARAMLEAEKEQAEVEKAAQSASQIPSTHSRRMSTCDDAAARRRTAGRRRTLLPGTEASSSAQNNRDYRQLREDFSSLQTTYKKLKVKFQEANQKVNLLQKEKSSMQQSLEKVQKKLSAAESKLRAALHENSSLSAEKAAHDRVVRTLNLKVNGYEKESNKLKENSRKTRETTNALASLEKKYEILRTQHEKLKTRTATWEVDLRAKTSSLEAATKELVQLRELKQQQSTQLFEYEESLRLQQIGIENMNAEIDELQEQNSELNSVVLKTHQETEQEIEARKQVQAKLNEEVEKCTNLGQSLTELQEQFDTQANQLEAKLLELDETTERLTSFEARCEELSVSLQALEAKHSQAVDEFAHSKQALQSELLQINEQLAQTQRDWLEKQIQWETKTASQADIVSQLTQSLEDARGSLSNEQAEHEQAVRSLESDKLQLEGKCAELYNTFTQSTEESERRLRELEQSLEYAKDALVQQEERYQKEKKELLSENEQRIDALQQRMDMEHTRMLEHEQRLNLQFKEQNQQWREKRNQMLALHDKERTEWHAREDKLEASHRKLEGQVADLRLELEGERKIVREQKDMMAREQRRALAQISDRSSELEHLRSIAQKERENKLSIEKEKHSLQQRVEFLEETNERLNKDCAQLRTDLTDLCKEAGELQKALSASGDTSELRAEFKLESRKLKMEIFQLKDQVKELNLSKSALTKALKDSKSLINFLEEEKEELESESEERIAELEAQLKKATSKDRSSKRPGLRVSQEDKENCVFGNTL